MNISNLFIFNGQSETLLTVFSYDSPKGCPFFDSNVVEELNRDYLFEFSVPSTHEDAIHVAEGNLVAFKDEDGNFQLFQIFKVEDKHDSNDAVKTAYCEHAIYEIADNIVKDKRVINGTATDALTDALSASRWQVGNVASLGTYDINFYYSNGMENLKKIQSVFGGEFQFRITISGKSITGKYVDLLTARGSDDGKRFEYTKDINSIKRTVDMSGLKTALYGRGKSSQTEEGGYTRKANFGTVEWVTPTNPVSKPLGQEWVGDPTALMQFGRDNGTKHRYGVMDFDIEDAAELLQTTYDALQNINKPLITYELSVLALEHLTGLSHEKVRIGDTVYVIDREFKPKLLVKARVLKIQRSLEDLASQRITLGNFIPLSTDLVQSIEEIKAQFNDNKGIWDKNGDPTATPVISDDDIENVTPNTPTNLTATGLFKTISVKWTFDPALYIAGYEVHGSKTAGFTPSTTTLLWRGRAGGYLHEANTAETWYFKVRALNTHGVASAYTTQVSASTIRTQTADYEDLSITSAKIASLSADKITTGTLDASKVNVTNMNADNIVSGTIKAQYIQIGSGTTFDSGYDPSAKLPSNSPKLTYIDSTGVYTGKVVADQLHVLATNLVNNPSRTNVLDGWSKVSADGSLTLGSSSTTGTNNLILTTSGNMEIRSNLFPVHPNQTYKISVSMYKNVSAGTMYFGLDTFDKNGNEIDREIIRVSNNSSAGLANNTYFDWTSATGWKDMVAYLIASNATATELPSSKNVGHNLKMTSNTAYAQLRFLNYYNDGVTNVVHVYSPSVIPVDSGEILFTQAKGGQLTLGGANNGYGRLQVLGADNEVIADLDASAGGYDRLFIGELDSPYGAFFSANTNSYTLYVNTSTGNNENTGLSSGQSVKTIQRALDLIPKYIGNSMKVTIQVTGNSSENVRVEGFIGAGYIEIRGNNTTLTGDITFNGNSGIFIRVFDLVINANNSANSSLFGVYRTTYVYAYNVRIYGRNLATQGFTTNDNSFLYLQSCEVYDVTTDAITSGYQGQLHINNCKGKGAGYGIVARYGGHISGNGSSPGGDGGHTYAYYGGQITYTFTINYGTASPPPPPPATEVTKQITATSADSYRSTYWANENTVKHGEYSSYGNNKGLWFFPDTSDWVGKTITSMRVYITRKNSSGSSASGTFTIRHHNYTTKPSGSPTVSSETTTASFKWGESKWVDLPSSFYNDFSGNTAHGICLYDSDGSPYGAFEPSATLEVTYK